MISHLGFAQSIMHGGYDNRNSRERNKNEIVLTMGASIDQNALRFSQMQYGLLTINKMVFLGDFGNTSL